MLVDLPEYALDRGGEARNFSQQIDRIIRGLGVTDDIGEYDTRLAQGVYRTGHNFGNSLRDFNLLVTESPFHDYSDPDNPWRKEMTDENREQIQAEIRAWLDRPEDFGVCDSWQQVLERWPEIETCDKNLIITVTELRREDQSPKGGWRWHKWGEYIGEQGPLHEYLYDDTHIDVVYTFSLFEVKV